MIKGRVIVYFRFNNHMFKNVKPLRGPAPGPPGDQAQKMDFLTKHAQTHERNLLACKFCSSTTFKEFKC